MRHDRTAEAMIVGLHRMSWMHSEYCKGLHEILAKADFRDLDSRSQNTFRIIKSTINFIHKGTLGVMAMTRPVIQERGWTALAPLEGHAEPAASRWVGLGGEGSCKTCRAKPARKPVYKVKDYAAFMPAILQDIWAGFVVSERYRQHQIEAIAQSEFFGRSEDGYAADSFYHQCGSLVNLGLICTGKPVQAFAANWLHKDIERPALNVLLTRNYGLPDICEVDQEKNWCNKCKKNVVDMPVNIFDQLKGGRYDRRDAGG